MTRRAHFAWAYLGAAFIAPHALVKPAKSNPDVEVLAVAARDPDRAATFAAKHGVPRIHKSYRDLLADPDIDAVYVPLPNSLHAQWSIRALKAGKHVLCEKPMASNIVEAEEMNAVAAASGRILVEAFHYRYHPLAIRSKEIIESGELGEIRRMDIAFCTPSIRPNHIRFRYDLAGGATMDLGCYAIDMMRFLTGAEPSVERAQAKLASPQVDRYMKAHLRIGDKTTVRMVCSMFSICVLRMRVHVEGEHGHMTVTNMMLPQLLYHRLRVKTPDGVRSEKFTKTPTYDFQLRAFVRTVQGEEAMSSTAASAVQNMRIIDDIYRAAGLTPRGMAP